MGKKKNAANQGSNKTRALNIVTNDQTGRFRLHPDCCAKLAEGLPLWVPPELFFQLTDGLRGYRKGLANVLVENILVFSTGGGRRLTGFPHVDSHLLALYNSIYQYAQMHGKKLGPLF